MSKRFPTNNGPEVVIQPLRVTVYRCTRCGKRLRTEQQATAHAVRCRCFHCAHYAKKPHEFLAKIMPCGTKAMGFGCRLRKWRYADGTFPPRECGEFAAKLTLPVMDWSEREKADYWVHDVPDYQKPEGVE